ncbi:MAG: ABC transporter ATP-binding protein [marine bacterium B5-7]|nr:MAG: ABC transporter ATP-binding protein [marine bacterium B5-7]
MQSNPSTTRSTVVSSHALFKSVHLGNETIDILEDVTLNIADNTTAAVSGTSGSGKTTLLGLLAGLDTPSHGEVKLLGESLSELDEDRRASLRRGRVGFVFQSFHLLPNLTAVENVSLALEVAGQPDSIETRASEALERVGLGQRLKHLPSQLSGGEQQRVALARAMSVRPRVLFADEPTGNLDHRTSSQIADLIFELTTELESTLVLVTHDRMLADRCDVHYRLEDGRLVI